MRFQENIQPSDLPRIQNPRISFITTRCGLNQWNTPPKSLPFLQNSSKILTFHPIPTKGLLCPFTPNLPIYIPHPPQLANIHTTHSLTHILVREREESKEEKSRGEDGGRKESFLCKAWRVSHQHNPLFISLSNACFQRF